MGWYFRKSASFGPFRMTFSKSGLSYSAGIKGARITTSSRGTYVSFGANGIYYRKKISGQNLPSRTPIFSQPEVTFSEPHTITSGAVDQITDSDSKDFIDELTKKSKLISYERWFGIIPFLTFWFISVSMLTDITFWLVSLLGSVCFIPWIMKLKQKDRERLLVEIYYDIDEKVKPVYDNLISHFSELRDCARKWQYLHAQQTNDYKYTAGASTTINRKPLLGVFLDKKPERIFKTNVNIPCIKLINTELYFFPERLIIKRGNSFGAILYKNITCHSHTTQFIEEASVPSDARIIGYTWRYLNKNGTPDKRFKNNYQIPVCAYSEYTFESPSGLFEKISTSKTGGFDKFISYITAIGSLQSNVQLHDYKLN